jgi:hypothetical protein
VANLIAKDFRGRYRNMSRERQKVGGRAIVGWEAAETVSFKRLILRAGLRHVNLMVTRLISVSDHMQLPEFHDVFRAILGWKGDPGYIVRIHGQEFNSFRRRTRSKALHEFKLHRQEKFLDICETLHM